MSEVAIVASGGANIASLQFALQRLGAASIVSADPQQIRAASHVILPGVGAAADGMSRLRRCGLDAVIPGLEQPVLGICLGMQLLYEASQEGAAQCLGIIPGRAARFAEAQGRPVPHMGWNTLDIRRPCALLEGLAGGEYAYFVHSYALEIGDATVASASYGAPFSACVQWRNFYGAQFHPERSGALGSLVLKNFLAIQ
ncbi:MAG TPA: imidazole glycerol phosphate synthase subunit HisH [Steroidobacteraceae bacterium]|nr:imidazole glycerol phosphate synthase subunit HisH [Steroidobacteraceae bacterium]